MLAMMRRAMMSTKGCRPESGRRGGRLLGVKSERWAIMRALIIANHPRMKAFCPGETAAWPMNKQNVMRSSANLHTTHKTRADFVGREPMV